MSTGTRVPSRPVTVRFEFTEHPKIYWLLLDWLGQSRFAKYAVPRIA